MKKTGWMLLLAVVVLLGCKKADGVGSNAFEMTSQDRAQSKVQSIDRKLIKEGRISFQTKDVEVTDKTIRSIVKGCGAWISDDRCFRSDSKLEYNLTIRVPAERYDSLVTVLLKEADIEKLESKSTSIKDVTEEYIDVETRLKVKKASEQKMMELLGKAKKMTDVLEIQKQLTELREEIESVEGRLKVLTDQMTYSTLEVSFYVKMPYYQRFFGSFWSAFKSGWDVFLYVLTTIAYLWVLILVVVVGRWGYKAFKRYQEEKRQDE